MDVLRISTFIIIIIIIIIIVIIIAVVRYHLYVGVLQLCIQTNHSVRYTVLQLICIYNLCYT